MRQQFETKADFVRRVLIAKGFGEVANRGRTESIEVQRLTPEESAAERKATYDDLISRNHARWDKIARAKVVASLGGSK